MTTRAVAAGLIVLIVACAVLYCPTLSAPSYLDDHYVLGDNPLIIERDGWKRIIFDNRLTADGVYWRRYRPVALLSFWVTNQVFAPSIPAHRATNILLHLANALLLALLAWRLLSHRGLGEDRALRIAVVAGALFALHPVFSVTVHQVYKRTTSLAAFFVLLGVLFGLRALTSEKPRRGAWALAVVLGVLAQLTKESAAAYPLLLGLCVLGAGAVVSCKRVAVLLTCCALPQITILALTFPSDAVDRGWLSYLLSQPRAVAEYVAAFFNPSRVVIISGLERAALPPGVWPVVAVAFLAAAPAVAWLLRKRAPLAALAVIWAAVSLAPTTTVLPMPIVGDLARAYLAAVGGIIAAAVALERAGGQLALVAPDRIRGLTAAAPAVAICVLCALGTRAVNTRHLNPVDVWRHQVRLYPSHGSSNANLCAALVNARAYAAAVRRCKTAEKLAPHNPFVAASLASAHVHGGDPRAAADVLVRARRRIGEHWLLVLTLAHLRHFEGDLVGAEALYLRVLKTQPESRAVRLYLTDTWLRLGKTARARRMFTAINRRGLDPGLSAVWRDLRRRLP